MSQLQKFLLLEKSKSTTLKGLVAATKAVSSVSGAAGYRSAVNQFSKSVVREIRTLRSVGAGGG
jgi:hypothetical protein